MDYLRSVSVFFALSIVYVASMKTNLEELMAKNINDTNGDTKENVSEFLNKMIKVRMNSGNGKQTQNNLNDLVDKQNTKEHKEHVSNTPQNDEEMSHQLERYLNNFSYEKQNKDLSKDNADKEEQTNDSTCQLRETMAWAECGHQVKCPSTCQRQDDCTFPYCNSKRKCACRDALCRDDKMCHFYRIACATTFTCRQGHCYCDAHEN